MAVYYKFKSAKDFDSVPIDGHFISVGLLKEKIFESKHLGRGTDFDLVVTNAQNNEEYLDEGMLIPKNTSVLIRRVPGRPRKPIITAPDTEHEQVNAADNMGGIEDVKSSFIGTDTSTKYADELEWDEFGNDLYAIPETAPAQSTVPVHDPHPFSKEDEDSKIKALIETPSLDWQQQSFDAFGRGRGFGRGMGGRMMGGRGFGRGGFENKTPPQGYVCYRCKVPGHFIQHCPTNGDPNFDVRRVKPPTGIPKSMLMATADGSYALPTGDAAALKPNEAVFEKEIEGMPTTRSATDFPPELHCPLCKEVMKDAVLTSKCCFTSFCDKCIRDHIISKSTCVCGATNVLADDLLPNKTLRDTISRILESNNSSADKSGSAFLVQDMESRNPQANVPSLMNSAVSKEQPVPASRPEKEETLKVAETIEQNRSVNVPEEQGQGVTPQVPAEAIHGLRTVKEAPSQGSALLAGEEVQQKQLEEAGKKKKKKKLLIPSGASEMPWGPAPELAHDYMMPMGPSVFNPYYGGVQPGLDGFMPPFPGPGPMPYMGYGPSPMDMAFGGAFPNNPFGGPQCMLPYGPPPQRDLAELAMGFNARPPFMSREEFEARKANLRQKRELERDGERELPKIREYGREGSSTVHVSSTRPKSKPISPPPSTSDHQSSRHHRADRRSPNHHPRDLELPRPSSKRKSDHGKSYEEDPDYDRPHKKADKHRHNDLHMYDDDYDQHHHRDPKRHHDSDFGHAHTEPSDADLKQKASSSVFSRISYQEKDSSAPRTLPSRDPLGHHRSNGRLNEEHKTVSRSSKFVADVTASSVDRESSDDADERHFKRRRPKHTSSPSRAVEEWPRHFKGSRYRERNHGGYSKRRRR